MREEVRQLRSNAILAKAQAKWKGPGTLVKVFFEVEGQPPMSVFVSPDVLPTFVRGMSE